MTPSVRERRHRGTDQQHLAGVGDQDDSCVNGTAGCPGPDAGAGALPCSACFLGGESA